MDGFAQDFIERLKDERSRKIIKVLFTYGKGLRFNELHRETGLSREALTKRLKELLEFGIIVKEPDPRHKQAVIYKINPAFSRELLVFEEDLAMFLMDLDTFVEKIAVAHLAAKKNNSELATIMLIKALIDLATMLYERFLLATSFFIKLHRNILNEKVVKASYTYYYSLTRDFIDEALSFLFENLILLAKNISLETLEERIKRIDEHKDKELREYKRLVTLERLETSISELKELVKEGIISEEFLNRIYRYRRNLLESESLEEAFKKNLEFYKRELKKLLRKS